MGPQGGKVGNGGIGGIFSESPKATTRILMTMMRNMKQVIAMLIRRQQENLFLSFHSSKLCSTISKMPPMIYRYLKIKRIENRTALQRPTSELHLYYSKKI